jgi:TolB-like protein/DNA-binding winged helix-turn-helix (wHTH) protein
MTDLERDRTAYKFGDFQVDVNSGHIRKNGRRIRLQEKPYQILCMLLARPTEVITREELRQRLWPADTYVDFDANLNTSLNRLRHALGDKASEQTIIKTIPRQGYRFVAPVTKLELAKEEAERTPPPEQENLGPGLGPAVGAGGATSQGRSRGIWIGLLASALAIAGISYFVWRSQSVKTSNLKGHVTILVTPLADMDGNQDRDLLGDNLTEETITRLGRVTPQQISVIARSTAMQYKGGRQTVAQMASEQHADYVLEGGYRRQGNQLRITAQLFNARNQSSVWSEVYERDTADLFTVERDVTEQIANSISQRVLPRPDVQPANPPQ